MYQAKPSTINPLCDVVEVLPKLGVVVAVVLRAVRQHFPGCGRGQSPPLDDRLKTRAKHIRRRHVCYGMIQGQRKNNRVKQNHAINIVLSITVMQLRTYVHSSIFPTPGNNGDETFPAHIGLMSPNNTHMPSPGEPGCYCHGCGCC